MEVRENCGTIPVHMQVGRPAPNVRPVKRRVTMQDVAKRARVTLTTVSSALHNTGRISPSLREQIQQIAVEMGYHPALGARLMRANRTHRLALIVFYGMIEKPGSANVTAVAESGHLGPIISAFFHGCGGMGYGSHIEYFINPKEKKAVYSGPEAFTSRSTDGALILGFVHDPSVRKWLDTHWEQYPWVSLDEPGRLSVSYDHAAGIYQAVQHLAGLGHRRIAYMGIDSPYRAHVEGRNGFQRATKELGLEAATDPRLIVQHKEAAGRPAQLADACRLAQELLQGPKRPTAIVANGIPDARAIIYAAMQMGLSVPRDLSVIAWGTAVDAEKGLPCLHAIEADAQSLVTTAIDLLRQRLSDEPVKETQILINPRIVERSSVAPPRVS